MLWVTFLSFGNSNNFLVGCWASLSSPLSGRTSGVDNQNTPKKLAMGLNRHFSKEDIQMASGYMKNAWHCQSSGKCKSNQKEISSHTCQNDFFFFKTPKCLQGCGEIDTFRVLIHIKCINFINKAMQSGG